MLCSINNFPKHLNILFKPYIMEIYIMKKIYIRINKIPLMNRRMWLDLILDKSQIFVRNIRYWIFTTILWISLTFRHSFVNFCSRLYIRHENIFRIVNNLPYYCSIYIHFNIMFQTHVFASNAFRIYHIQIFFIVGLEFPVK